MNVAVGDLIDDTCKLGQGAECCRYLVMDPDLGFACGKSDDQFRAVMDQRVFLEMSTARGDNCDGLGMED